MAIRTLTVVYDDLDGTTDGVDTYRFAFNGVRYEIDLSRPHFDQMAAAFQPFITAARRLPTAATPKQSKGSTNAEKREANAQVRRWWVAHWQEQNLPEARTRGAIPPAVRDAYHAAH